MFSPQYIQFFSPFSSETLSWKIVIVQRIAAIPKTLISEIKDKKTALKIAIVFDILIHNANCVILFVSRWSEIIWTLFAPIRLSVGSGRKKKFSKTHY